MLLSSFLYRRMRICKFRHDIGAIASGACPNNAPAKPTRPHHRKLVPDPLAVDPVYVWAYHPLIVRLWRIIQRSTQRPPNGCVQADAACRFETRVYPWDWYTLRGSSDGRNNCCSSETRFGVGIRILPLFGEGYRFFRGAVNRLFSRTSVRENNLWRFPPDPSPWSESLLVIRELQMGLGPSVSQDAEPNSLVRC